MNHLAQSSPIRLVNTNPIRPDSETIPHALELALRDGFELFIAQGDKEPEVVTAKILIESAGKVAKKLLQSGLPPRGRVVIMLPTSHAWLAAFFGTLLAGGVPVPVGPTFTFGGIDRYVQTVRHIAIDCEAFAFIGNEVAENHATTLKEGNQSLKYFWKPSAFDSCDPTPVIYPSSSPTDTGLLQYTSGTTSLPKGVVLSHRALLVNAFMIGERTNMNSRDGGISWLPLFHDMGLIGALITSLHWRYPLVMMPTESFLMHPRRWLQWIARKRLTMSVAPNFAFQTAVERVPEKVLGDLDLSSWRLAFNGSEMVRSATLRAFTERFAPRGFHDSAHQPVYGMAENALAATFPSKDKPWSSLVVDRLSLEAESFARPPRDEHALRADYVSVGTPLAGVSVEIRTQEDHALAEGQAGMIYIKSPSLMDGYFHQEQKTDAVLREGWLQTGDIGFIRDGELYITGRSKELIIKRGRNYYPDDIEMVAGEAAGPKALRVAVIGCENAQEGTEDIVLMIETHTLLAEERERIERDVNGALISALGIRADVTAFVPPRTITYTTSGKVQRAPLRERYLSGAIGRT